MTTTKTTRTRTTKAAATPTAPVVETPTPSASRPSGVEGIIPDGHRWTSSTGVACYKVPVKQMQDVLFTLPKLDVAKLTDDQLARAKDYCDARYEERKGGEYFVFPVKFEKQADINNRYWTVLAQFSKAVQAEQAQRHASVLFGA